MTPQEKANELVCKYLFPQRSFIKNANLVFSKECALIVVNEILNNVLPNNFEYWQQVKQEIENL